MSERSENGAASVAAVTASPPVSREDAAQQIERAKGLWHAGRHDLAEALFDHVLAAFPEDATARRQAMAHALKHEDFRRLAALAEAGLAHRPDDLALMRDRGLARRRLGDLAGAIDDLERVRQADPGIDAQALMELGRALAGLKRHEAALAAFDMAAAKAPRHPPVLQARIAAYREADHPEALTLAGAARALLPDLGVFLEEELACLAKLGRHGDVVATADAAVDGQMQRPRARSILARSLLVTGPDGRAERHLLALLAEMPDAPWLHGGLIDLALRRGDRAGAIARAEAGCAARPKDAFARLRLAHLCEEAGQNDRAEAELARLTAEDPGFLRGWMERARLALARGDREEADLCYARVLEADPSHRLARSARIRLAREAHAPRRAFGLCWIDPGDAPEPGGAMTETSHPPAFPVQALELAKSLDDPGLALRVLEMIVAALPEAAMDHLPDIARHAESMAQPAIAARCYLELAGRPSLSARAAIAMVQRAHAMTEPALREAVKAKLRQKLPPEHRAFFDIRTVEICHGPEAALAAARGRGRGHAQRDLPAAQYLARLLSASGNDPLAERYLGRCVRHWPKVEALRVAQIHTLLKMNQIAQAEACLARFKADFPSADARPLALNILLAAHRTAEAMALIRAAMAEREFPFPLLEALMLAVASDDLEAAEWLGARYRAMPRSNVSASFHFGLTHPGALLNDLRIFRVATRNTDAAGASVDSGARSFFAAANQVLNRHFDALQEPKAETVIPRRIFQYWDSTTAPPELEALMAGWAAAPGFEYLRLDAHSAQNWLLEHYDAQHMRAFRAANHVAEASDFLRLCVLHRQGGIYMDSDNKLIGDAGALIEGCGPMLLFRDPFGAVPNDVIATIPGHPVIADALAMARDALLAREKDLTWGKTGPGLLTRAVAGFLVDKGDEAHRMLRILPLRAMSVCIHPCMDLPYKMTPKYWNDRVGVVAQDIRSAMARIAGD